MKTAVYVLYQRHEFSKAACFLTHVADFLSDHVNLYLLVNDADCPAMRAFARSTSRHIKVHTSGRNLGVAGGRNHIIRIAIDAGAEFLISCDTDILFDFDYFYRIRRAYFKLKDLDRQVGLVQPILLSGHDVSQCFSVLRDAKSWDEIQRRLGTDDTSLRESFWLTIADRIGEPAALASIFHCGMSNLWLAHFGPSVRQNEAAHCITPGQIETFGTQAASLRNDRPVLRNAIADGKPIRIASTAGGVSAFHRHVFEDAGGYDEIFNPFGFEDSEFSFRTSNRGFNHYLITDLFAIHDPFVAGQNRTLLHNARVGRLRGVETASSAASDLHSYAIRQSIFYGLSNLASHFEKFAKLGQEERRYADDKWLSAIVSYAFEFFIGYAHVQANSPTGSTSTDGNAARLLEPGDVEIADLRIPLDAAVSLVASRAVKSGCVAKLDNVGLRLFGCRVEETTEDGILSSLYFDASAHISRRSKPNQFDVGVDAIFRDKTYRLEIQLALNGSSAVKTGLVDILHWSLSFERSGHGTFSDEPLHPAPSLHRSREWVPFVRDQFDRISNAFPNAAFSELLDAIAGYLIFENHDSKTNATAASSLATHISTRRKRLLLFTDSRGQYKIPGDDYKIFGERLMRECDADMDAIYCPMRWTTTLDFLSMFEISDLQKYDRVVLHTGIVDWSPRKLSSAIDNVYDNQAEINLENARLNTHNYANKVINNKKTMFDLVFGEREMGRHFRSPFHDQLDGEPSINMYRLSSARSLLIPRLSSIENLVFINANRIVPGWNGNSSRRRPVNMEIIHDYSFAFADALGAERVVDLLAWDYDDVRHYTCDNRHLTAQGSDYIFEKLRSILKESLGGFA